MVHSLMILCDLSEAFSPFLLTFSLVLRIVVIITCKVHILLKPKDCKQHTLGRQQKKSKQNDISDM